jgi:hypothetical protein
MLPEKARILGMGLPCVKKQVIVSRLGEAVRWAWFRAGKPGTIRAMHSIHPNMPSTSAEAPDAV